MEMIGMKLNIESIVSILFIVVALSAFILTIAFYIGQKKDARRKKKDLDQPLNSNPGKYFKKTEL